ncbi:uncharacterized protein SCODWIG_01003 [Saccharomycodes ludwigii]|uniref:Transcription factor STP1 n=1 Tax=Saccharomycodes ludwigii TaxID=36035 RepID=A0A376B3P8_9ASCO|nr:uncharacterized protein SCODWIG_01003 [Saccharomycodes ludwigii]
MANPGLLTTNDNSNNKESFIKRISVGIVRFFTNITNTVIVSKDTKEVKGEKDIKIATAKLTNNNNEQKARKNSADIPIATTNNENIPNNNNNTKNNSPLFPKTINIDSSLAINSTAIPCSMDISTLASPALSTTNCIDTNDNNLGINNVVEFKGCSSSDSSLNRYIASITKQEGTDTNITTATTTTTTNNNNNNFMTTNTPVSPDISTSTANPTTNIPPSDKGAFTEKFVCHYCDAEFRIRGYLTRHIKKHAVQKAYHCPFFDSNASHELKCHSTGGFSRRDTYKTHLKTRHFVYPPGVKPKDRAKSVGKCGLCGAFFTNGELWAENHIENGECPKLPKGFQNQSRKKKRKPHINVTSDSPENKNDTDEIFNSNSRREHASLKMVKTSNGVSRFISSEESYVEPKIFLNKDALEAMAIVVDESISNSPNHTAPVQRLSNNKILLQSDNFKGIQDRSGRLKKRGRKKKAVTLASPNASIATTVTSNSDVSLNSTSSNESLNNKVNGISATNANTMSTGVVKTALGVTDKSNLLGGKYTKNKTNSAVIDEQNSNSSAITSPHINSVSDHSPIDDAGLEKINTSSSLSSNDSMPIVNRDLKHYSENDARNTGIDNNVSTDIPNYEDDYIYEPLDTEQSSLIFLQQQREHPMITTGTSNNNETTYKNSNQDIAINKTLREQMNTITLSERHLRETEQYRKFYNFTMGNM